MNTSGETGGDAFRERAERYRSAAGGGQESFDGAFQRVRTAFTFPPLRDYNLGPFARAIHGAGSSADQVRATTRTPARRSPRP